MKSNSLVLILGIFFFQFSAQFASAKEAPQFKVENSEINSSPGESVQINIQVKLPDGFHLYADQLKLLNTNPDSYKLGQIQTLPKTEFFDKHTQKNRLGFYENGTVVLQIESPENISKDSELIHFDLRYQICSDQVCYLPKNEPLQITLNYKKMDSLGEQSVAASETKSGLFDNLDEQLSKNIYWAFVLVFLAGILTSFTPCIFPMIPITLSVLGYDANKNTRMQNFLKSLFYVHGIALTYSILGVIAAMTGSLFGQALSNKYVLSGMVILFVLMAFGMWGFYDLQMPAFIRKKFGGSAHNTSESYLRIFITGLFAGVVASPCVGPVLVSILSYVSTTKNAFLGFTLLFTYAMGLGLVFILIGIFSQFLKYLPRSGAWMNVVKFIMGYLMICMAIYYLNFIIPIFKYFSWPTTSVEKVEEKNPTVNWIPYSEAALQSAIQNNRPVMIDFFAEWCAACHELKDKTFINSEFLEMSKGFDLIVVDATEDKPEIQKILTKYKVKGLPTVIFVNKKGTVINDLTFTQFLEWKELKPKMQTALDR